MKIKSFATEDTFKIYSQQFVARYSVELQKQALRKLIMLDHARNINDLRSPPGNRLEKLVGDREGQFSIRVNQQFRICFWVKDDGFYGVELVDYHS